MTTRQIKTYGTNYSQEALYGLNSRDTYICANSSITRGVTGIPDTLDQCFDRFSGIKDIAEYLGFIEGASGASGASGGAGTSGGKKYNYTLWTGSTLPNPNLTNTFTPVDLYLDKPSVECDQITTTLSQSWLGCLWGTPEASLSCTCPDIGPNFVNYLKLRQNVATFWNTPKITPIKRVEFLDALKYGQKADFTVAGDFKLKLGQVVYINVNAASGYPYSSTSSPLNNYYYIVGIKHVVTTQAHETALSVTRIPENLTSTQAGGTYAADYT
jgi:hypothetical protein